MIVVDSSIKLDNFRRHTENYELGAVDIETTIANPFAGETKLVSVACSFGDVVGQTFVFKDDEWLASAKPNLESQQWVMHNGLFDRLMMLLWGYDLPLAHDTMAMQYLLDPDEPKSLEKISEKFLGLSSYKNIDYHNILDHPWEEVAEMNAEDTRRTLACFRPLADLINADPELSRVYQWIILPAINELIEVTVAGVPVDEPRLTELTELYAGVIDSLLWEILNSTPKPDPAVYKKGWPKRNKTTEETFNPASTKQVAHVLFDLWKLPVLEKTATGNPSTGADTLIQLETFYTEGFEQEWLGKLREFRKAKKVNDSYLKSWPKFIANGRMNPRYKLLHVVTGRLSSSEPNIQNVPRNKEFRRIFGGVEGYTWMKADYSQAELRIASWLAQEPTMLQAYQENKDLHALTAELVLKDSTPGARQVAKSLNFGLLYGAGANTLRRIARLQYGVFLSEDEAHQHRETFFDTYPALAGWHERSKNELILSGVVRSPLGRVRYLPNAKIPWKVEEMRGKKMHAILEGINMPVQSMASDVLLYSMNKIGPQVRALGASIIAEVHDELDLLVPDDRVDEVAVIVKREMEDTSWLERFGINLDVPMLSDIEVGTHWGSLTDWKQNGNG
ncbi:MAG: hypothetical protein JRJ51_17170 [Deltaproteobacteria bacterium]|nr:hypothetical protein [Deltaproteobacteria bacterium]